MRFKKQYMQTIPIPPATEADKTRLADLAGRCAEAAAVDDADTLAALEAEIDQIVYRLFDLSADEVRLIEESLGIDKIIPFEPTASAALSLPTTERKDYEVQGLPLLIYVREFVALHGDKSNLPLLAETINYLVNPDTHLTENSAPLSEADYTTWRSSYPNPTFEGVFDLVGQLEGADEIQVNRDTLAISIPDNSTLLEAENREEDEWIEFDLQLVRRTLQSQETFDALLSPPPTAPARIALLQQFAIA